MLKRILKGVILYLWLSACILICMISVAIVVEVFELEKNKDALFITGTIISVIFFLITYSKILDTTRKRVDITSEKIEFGISKIKDLKIEPDSEYYEQAEQEINDKTFDKGLWAKALVKAKGNEVLRKPEYIKLRAKQLQKINRSNSP